MDRKIKLAQSIANLLDNKFKIFGFRFGLDPILGLIPGLGDFSALLFSTYLISLAREINIPRGELNKMIGIMLIDFILGWIPGVGDIGDFVFKSNEANMKILLKHYHRASETIEEGQIIG